jgi:hypothetical protein
MIGACAAMLGTAATPTVHFGTPQLVGSSNYSAPNGSRYWFPSLSMVTNRATNGIQHVVQHVTLARDGTCRGWKGNNEWHPNQTFCEEVLITEDGGDTYTLVKGVVNGSSGNFNGYNDLGTLVPAPTGTPPPTQGASTRS